MVSHSNDNGKLNADTLSWRAAKKILLKKKKIKNELVIQFLIVRRIDLEAECNQR